MKISADTYLCLLWICRKIFKRMKGIVIDSLVIKGIK